jgi:hypothetical protein
MANNSNNQTTNISQNDSSLSGMNARRDNIPDTNLAQPVGYDRGIDNPLLAKRGVPVTSDDLRDSTNRIINASTTNIIRDPNNLNIWNVNPDEFNSQQDANDPNKRFDLGKFNKVFDVNREISKSNQRVKDIQKLNELSKVDTTVSLYDLNISQILINTKNTWFNVLDDLLDRRFNLETFSKENRLFYIGLTILVITVILYLYTMIIFSDDDELPDELMSSGQPIYIYGTPNHGY